MVGLITEYLVKQIVPFFAICAVIFNTNHGGTKARIVR